VETKTPTSWMRLRQNKTYQKIISKVNYPFKAWSLFSRKKTFKYVTGDRR